MQGVFLDDRSIHRGDLDLTPLHGTPADWTFLGAVATDGAAAAIRGADIAVSNKVPLDGRVLAGARRLKLVCIAATGADHIDLAAADRLGVTVCNVRGYATASVVEHVYMVALALRHRLHDHTRAVHRGAWRAAGDFSLLDYPFRELAGGTLGVIGYGELGRAVARAAAAFGLRVRVAQRPGGPEQPGRPSLREVLAESDILTLHCPLTAATRNLIARPELEQMRDTALLINTARGGIVNEADLAEALRDGVIAGAAVDVLSEEPPRHGNPLLDARIPNLIVTPHVAWAGRQARQALIDELAANVNAFLAGTPRNVLHA